MNRKVAGAAAVTAVGVVVVRRRAARKRAEKSEVNRWLAVTVNCPPERLAEPPEPLARLGDAIEARVTPAPGGKGSELAARLLEPGPSGPVARTTGEDPRQAVRMALRETKSIVETGEVLRPDEPSGTRTGARGKILDLAGRHSGREGRS